MQVPLSLIEALKGDAFEKQIADFVIEQKLLSDRETLKSQRFLSRSIAPHIRKLSERFNRLDEKSELGRYWRNTQNPTNLRLAYFLYFMPCNLFRMASVFAELRRLGYPFSEHPVQGLELGAGQAAGAAGATLALSEFLSSPISWSLIERDRNSLRLGEAWLKNFAQWRHKEIAVRGFHRKIEFESKRPLLPRNSPRFDFILSSYFLNEEWENHSLSLIADQISHLAFRHLQPDGLFILVEPALRLQSRKLLELRAELINRNLKVLLPCLGNQACGAFSDPEDWCHEEVTWWRPPYLQKIDEIVALDRRTLPFSYLVFTRSEKKIEELLPALKGASTDRYRLVSPSFETRGRDWEFYLCGQEGKTRNQYRGKHSLNRGDILLSAKTSGKDDSPIQRVDSFDSRI